MQPVQGGYVAPLFCDRQCLCKARRDRKEHKSTGKESVCQGIDNPQQTGLVKTTSTTSKAPSKPPLIITTNNEVSLFIVLNNHNLAAGSLRESWTIVSGMFFSIKCKNNTRSNFHTCCLLQRKQLNMSNRPALCYNGLLSLATVWPNGSLSK